MKTTTCKRCGGDDHEGCAGRTVEHTNYDHGEMPVASEKSCGVCNVDDHSDYECPYELHTDSMLARIISATLKRS